MNIVLIQCNWNNNNSIYPNLGSVIPYQPIELCYMANALKEKHNVMIIDAFLDNLSYKEIAQRVYDFKTEVVVVDTANTYLFWRCCFLNIDIVRNTVKMIKKLNDCTCILCGPHGTVDPVGVLKNIKADYVLRGEPDLAIPEFVNSKFNMNTKGISSLSKPDNGIAVVNNLNDLPNMECSLLKMNQYKGHAWLAEQKILKNGALIEFSRGCPYHCSFCFKEGFRDNFRMKSAEKVVVEIAGMKEKYNIDYYFFIDEIFNYDSDNFRKLLKGLKDLNIKYGCQCRPDSMSYEMIDLMKESGCFYIEYGLESINKGSRELIGKNIDLKKTFSVINYSKKNIENVVCNLLDFNSINILMNDDTNEISNSSLGIQSGANALETIVFFPETKLYHTIQDALHVKAPGWELSIRLYWLTSKLKREGDKSVFYKRMWKFILLHFPMSLLKIMMNCKYIYKPLEISYGRKKRNN